MKRTVLISTFAALFAFGSAVIAPATAEDKMQSEAASEILSEGAWTKKSFDSNGTWTIYQEDRKTFIKLSDDFKTKRAPDLKIFLSPQESSTTTSKNATDGAVLVTPLTSNKRGQTYEIPAGTDLSAFRSVLIHCEQFSKLWSAADL